MRESTYRIRRMVEEPYSRPSWVVQEYVPVPSWLNAMNHFLPWTNQPEFAWKNIKFLSDNGNPFPQEVFLTEAHAKQNLEQNIISDKTIYVRRTKIDKHTTEYVYVYRD